jgi:hypothetical protein
VSPARLPVFGSIDADDARNADGPSGVHCLVYQAEAGDVPSLRLVQALAGQVTNPVPEARAAALGL